MLRNHNTKATKIMLFALGGGIGAAIALLFAPKSGKDLRQDIADAATKGYDETLDAASRAKGRSLEYLETAKEKGGEVFETIADKASAIKDEFTDDAEKVGGFVKGAAKRVSDTIGLN